MADMAADLVDLADIVEVDQVVVIAPETLAVAEEVMVAVIADLEEEEEEVDTQAMMRIKEEDMTTKAMNKVEILTKDTIIKDMSNMEADMITTMAMAIADI